MLSPRGKKELKINQRRILINSIEIGIPAPEQVFILGQRHTSNGKVVGRVRNSKTLNYKSFTPHRDGLFCERIFGPVQSYICACGKQGPLTTSKGTLKFCPRCEVEYTDQRARRYRVGYIGLVSPVTHIWHLKGRPSYLSLFLGKRKKTLATLAYCNDYLVEQAFSKVDVNRKFSLAKQHRPSPSGASAGLRPARPTVGIGADFFKDRILKGLTGSKAIKGLTLSREQERSKVWYTFRAPPEGGRTRALARRAQLFLAEGQQLPERLPETNFVAKFDEQNLAFPTRESAPERLDRANFLKSLRFPKGSTTPLPPSSGFRYAKVCPGGDRQVECKASQKRITLSYTRSQTLPFLPTFICEFHLRDGLLSFFDTFPPTEDIPIPVYCQIPRRYPLRDVHKFMADQAFSKVQVEQSSTKGWPCSPKASKASKLSNDQRSETNCTGRRTGQASKNSQIFGYKIFDFARTSFDKLLAGQNLGTPSSNRTGPLLLNRRSNLPLRLPVLSLRLSKKGPTQSVVLGATRQTFSSSPVRRCSPKASSGFGLLTAQRPKSLQVGRSTPASQSFDKDKTNKLLNTANFSSKMRVIGGLAQLCLPKREVGLINGKDVFHIPIGTVNEKRLCLREVLLSLLLDRIMTTLIGLTPSLSTYLSRPEPTISKPKVLVGAEPMVVMTRRVGSQMGASAAEETGTFDLPSRETGTTFRQSAGAGSNPLRPTGTLAGLARLRRAGPALAPEGLGQTLRSKVASSSAYRCSPSCSAKLSMSNGGRLSTSKRSVKNTWQKLAKGEVENLRFAQAVSDAPNKTEGFVMGSHVWTPNLRHGWPRKGLKEFSNDGKVKRLNGLLRVKRFPLAKPIWLLSSALSRPLRGRTRSSIELPNQHNQIVGDHEQAKGEPRAIDNSIVVFEGTLDKSASAPSLSSTLAERLPVLSFAEQEAEHALSLLLNRRGFSSTQNKSSYSKCIIVSENLRFKHAKGFSLPVIGESPARLTIRLVFADGWSDLGKLSKAWLANPYRLSAGAATVSQATEAYQQRNKVRQEHNSRLEYISNQGHFEDAVFSLDNSSDSACSASCSAKLSTSKRTARVHIPTKVAAEPPVRSWVGLRSNLSIADAVRFGESVEDWLEYWFDRWLQKCYAVKPATDLAFVQARLSQSQTLLLVGARSGPYEPWSTRQHKPKSSTRPEVLINPKALKGLSFTPLRGEPERSSSLSKAVRFSVEKHFCSPKGPLLLLALRSYALRLTDRPGRNYVPVSRFAASYNTPFFSHSQSTSIKIQSLWSRRYENFSRAKVKPVLQAPTVARLRRAADFATQSSASACSAEHERELSSASPSNGLGGQTLLRKVTKLNENQIRSVGPKHNISSYLYKHDQRVKWVKREVFSSDINQRGRFATSFGPEGNQRYSYGTYLGCYACSPSASSSSASACSASCSASLSTSKRSTLTGLARLRRAGPAVAKMRGINHPDPSAQPIGSETDLWPVRPSVLLAPSGLRDRRIDWHGEAKRKTGASIVGTTFQLDPKGPKSVINIDSQVWFPEIVTIFKSSEKPRWRTAKQADAGTRFRVPPKGGSRAELLLSVAEHGLNFSSAKVIVPSRPKKQNLNNKNLIFSEDRDPKNYLTDETTFSESDAPASKSIEENISVGGTLPELRYGWPRRGLRNEVERMLVLSEAEQEAEQAPLTNPRFVWARRALENYRGTGLRDSPTRPQQLNKSASVLRSAIVQTPLELANQAQDGRTKPDISFGNEDDYGYEEGPVSSIDDEPEINRVNGRLLASRSKVSRTDSDSRSASCSAKLSTSKKFGKAQLRLVEQNATESEADKGGTDSYMKAQLDLQAIQEVLSYTGGGALRELLRCFDTQAFSVILLNEIKLLREYHKGYFLYEYDQVSHAGTTFRLVAPQLQTTLGVTGGRPEAGWAEGPRTPLERPLLSKVDQLDNAEGFVRRRKLNKSDSTPRSASAKAEHGALALFQNQNGFVKPLLMLSEAEQEGEQRSSKTKQSEKDNKVEYDTNYEELPEEINRFSRAIHRNARRLKIVQLLMRNKRRPEWMLISALPVLPPDLRPILQMSENLIVASDLNTLYQRVIYRNNRQYKLRIVEWSYATSLQRLVQDAVDRLIENGKGGSKPFLTPGGRPLKSLSDTLKGKKGRFRLNLLGKRVDFSGRSVIVVSPYLKIHECGLPREMALELYQYLLIRQMLLKRQVSSVILAKRVIRQQKAFVWDTLRELIYHHPVLLNRAPTLHRLGIQAFQPKLVLGSTILLHPLVCAGFNADFDGDQMGVHLPLCDEARAEAWDLLWSRNNLLSPATGEPILLPSQDMVLGFYHMTALLPSRYATSTAQSVGSARSIARSADKTDRRRGSGFVQINARPTQVRPPFSFEKGLRKSHFFSPLDVVRAYQNGDLDIHTPIWLQWTGKIENSDSDQTPLEVRITSFGVSTQLYPSYKSRKDASSQSTATFNLFLRTTPGRVIVNNLFLVPTGFRSERLLSEAEHALAPERSRAGGPVQLPQRG